MPRLLSIDLGSHAVKMSTSRVNGRKVELEDHHARAVVQDGTPPVLDARLDALRELIAEIPRLRPTSADQVVAALPASLATFKRLGMPFSDPAQIEKTLGFAVENEVPFELEDMVLGWRLAETGLETQVMALLAREDIVGDWLSGLAEQSLDPKALYVDADCYAAWGDPGFEHVGEESDLVGVIDIGHIHTTVSIVRNGAVQVARSINVGGWNFTRAIQEALDCSWEQAERLKEGDAHIPVPADEDLTDPGIPRHSGYAGLPPEARAAVDASIGMLLAEIRSTLIDTEDKLGGEIVEVRLTGGSSRIDELWEYLGSDLGVPIQKALDPFGVQVNGRFALSHALAGAASGNGTPPIDLRVGSLSFRGGNDVLRTALMFGITGTSVFTLAAIAMFVVQFFSLSSELGTAEAAVIKTVTDNIAEVDESQITSGTLAASLMREQTLDAQQRAAALGDRNSAPPTMETYLELANAMPVDTIKIDVKDLTISKSFIKFNATTDSYASSAQVEEALKKVPKFSRVELGEETKVRDQVKFPISIPLGEPTEGEEG